MAKFKNDNLDLLSGQYIDFNDANTVHMGYDTELYVNTTISGLRAVQLYHMVRYDQLTEASGTLQDQIDDINIEIEDTNEFIELLDTPTTYSGFGDYILRVNESEDGVIFVPSTLTSGTEPPASGTGGIWYNNTDQIIYYWDEVRNKWLSVYTHNYLFTYSGNIDGLYMSVGNVVNSYAHFHILRDATVTAITADQDPTGSSDPDKNYEIRANGTDVFNFDMITHEYTNEVANTDIYAGDSLQMYISGDGPRVRDPIVNLEIRWRYDI